jgi:hypothetical protein
MKYARPLLPILLLFVVSAIQARAQADSVRLKISKMESNHRRNTYQDASGAYRHQQVNSAIYYAVELVSLNTTKPADLKIKWAILVDPTKAEAHGNSYSWTPAAETIVEGERQCKIAVGQRYAFNTDSIDLDTVMTNYDYEGRRYTYGGSIHGYLVEVYDGDRLVASDGSPTDIKSQIDQFKAKHDKKTP